MQFEMKSIKFHLVHSQCFFYRLVSAWSESIAQRLQIDTITMCVFEGKNCEKNQWQRYTGKYCVCSSLQATNCVRISSRKSIRWLGSLFLYNFAEFSVFLNNIWNLSFLLLFLLCLKRCRFDVVNFDVFNRTSSFFKFVNLTRNGFAIKKCAHTTKIKILYSKRIQIKKFNKQTLKKKFNFSLFLCSAM